MRRLLAFALLAVSDPAKPDVLPVQDRHDPRIATLKYQSANVFRLTVAVGEELALILPPGESVAAINLASPDSWQVNARDNSQIVALRPMRPVPDVMLTVTTSAREYRFVLSTAPNDGLPLIVRIVGVPRTTAHASSQKPAESEIWALSGNRELRPSLIRDDGVKTYLEWDPSVPIPAIFAVDRLGREEMVNGFMRGQTFVIDRVYDRLLFRIDRAEAEARRQPVRRRS